MPGRYLLSNDAPEAMDRFTAFTTLFDPATFRHLDGLGLAAGWRCWEVGAGGTSVVTFLSDRVGPAGYVLASDINVSWAGEATAPNVEVVEHDVAADPAPDGPFDLVHARLVLVHVPERDAALATMVGALRPGGVLLIEDADPALQPLSCPDEIGPAQVLANRIRRGFRTLLAERGVELPGERSRLQRPRDGHRQPHCGPAPRARHCHRGRDRPAPGERGIRLVGPGPAADDLLLGSPPACRLSGTGGRTRPRA
jgi:SAM-dependent methyltransferase